MKLVVGFNWEVEERANQILKDDRAKFIAANSGAYSFSEINDWLSEGQLELRMSREVYSAQPIEKQLFQGLYHRKYNPKAHTPARQRKIASHELVNDDTCRDTGTAGITPNGFPTSWSGPFA